MDEGTAFKEQKKQTMPTNNMLMVWQSEWKLQYASSKAYFQIWSETLRNPHVSALNRSNRKFSSAYESLSLVHPVIQTITLKILYSCYALARA